MRTARRHRAFGAITGWWATAGRALALVLALAMAAPTAGLAEDLAFHQGVPRTELAVASDATLGPAQVDPGSCSHVHCGCHVAVSPRAAVATVPVLASRPSYARPTEDATSIFPDRLPRPPRT